MAGAKTTRTLFVCAELMSDASEDLLMASHLCGDDRVRRIAAELEALVAEFLQDGIAQQRVATVV